MPWKVSSKRSPSVKGWRFNIQLCKQFLTLNYYTILCVKSFAYLNLTISLGDSWAIMADTVWEEANRTRLNWFHFTSSIYEKHGKVQLCFKSLSKSQLHECIWFVAHWCLKYKCCQPSIVILSFFLEQFVENVRWTTVNLFFMSISTKL